MRSGDAIDEWTDAKCDEFWAMSEQSLSARPFDFRAAVMAIKRRNAHSAQLQANERFDRRRIRELEAELAEMRKQTENPL